MSTSTPATHCGEIRALTDNYSCPPDACNTYRAVLFDSLAHLERDLHEHVHKENNILLPQGDPVGKAADRSTENLTPFTRDCGLNGGGHRQAA